MMILACDTSTKFLSVAIVKDDKILKEYHSEKKDASDDLFIIISRFLKSLDIKLNDFDLFAIGIGPGSFTGLRIGTCAFKTFAFCDDKPLVGINSFDAIACNIKKRNGLVCVIEDARKGKVYAGIYTFDKKQRLKTKQKPALFFMESLLEKIKEPAIFTGGGLEKYKEYISLEDKKFSLAGKELWYPKAGVIAQLAAQRFKKGKIDDPRKLKPLYLHSEKANITKPKKLI